MLQPLPLSLSHNQYTGLQHPLPQHLQLLSLLHNHNQPPAQPTASTTNHQHNQQLTSDTQHDRFCHHYHHHHPGPATIRNIFASSTFPSFVNIRFLHISSFPLTCACSYIFTPANLQKYLSPPIFGGRGTQESFYLYPAGGEAAFTNLT